VKRKNVTDPSRPKVFLAAGEESGDLHAAGLAQALRELRPDVTLLGVGGPKMASAGVRLIADFDPLAVVGLTEVLPRLPRILSLLRSLKQALAREEPHLYVAVDAPDFNFRLMGHARRLGIPVVYFIVPQFWAWRRGRLRVLTRHVRRALTIFPFEVPLLEEAGVSASFVGHPLAETLEPPVDRRPLKELLGWRMDRPLVAILPGSRAGEWKRHRKPLLETVQWVSERRRDIQWGWSIAPGLLPPQGETTSGGGIRYHHGRAQDLLRAADAALVASGTATLEAALLETPMIVHYRLAPLTSFLARRWVRVPHFAMVNLLAGREVVPEFFQSAVRASNMGSLLLRLLNDPSMVEKQRQGFLRVRDLLMRPGAYRRAAEEILDVVGSPPSRVAGHG
jgi:lipid-A-disaccharide synthase